MARVLEMSRSHLVELSALSVTMALALTLRLGFPEVVEFRQDEANLSLLARQMAQGRIFPLHSIDSSVGILQPPALLYYFLPPYLLTSDPLFATQYMGAMAALAVLLSYFIARRYFGVVPALCAAALFAASPWAVFFSRKIWPADQLALLTVVTFGSGMLGLLDGKRWAQLIFPPALALTGQNHYLNFVLLLPTLYLLWQGRRRLTRYFWFGVALALLLSLPFLVGPAFASLAEALTSSGLARTNPERSLTVSAESFLAFAELLSGADLPRWTGTHRPLFLERLPISGALPLFHAVSALGTISAAWLALRSLVRRDLRTPVDVTLLLWLLCAPLATTLTWFPTFNDHYLLPSHPAAYLCIGAFVSDLLRTPKLVRRFAAPVGSIALVAIVALQAWLQLAFLDFVGTYATPGGFSTPLGMYMRARQAILAQQPEQVLARLDGQYIGYHEQASVWNFLLYDVPTVRFLQAGIEVYPSAPTLYISDRCDGTDGETFYWRRDPITSVPEGCFHITYSAPTFNADGFLPAPQGLRFANTARITAYRWQPESGCLALVWQAESPAYGVVSDFFQGAVKFYNAAGEQVAQADGYFWNGRYWRAGDLIVRTFCADQVRERADQIVSVRVGLYTIEDRRDGRFFHNVDVLDITGMSVGQHVEIKLKTEG
ncbi:MAG: glycosyltransferase family 39 protein [Anaerolineae bacterium]|nr:glycosyltransferase family 39 protein [Anaerolineae bacterium]